MTFSFKISRRGRRYTPKPAPVETSRQADESSENPINQSSNGGMQQDREFEGHVEGTDENAVEIPRSSASDIPPEHEVSFTLNIYPNGFFIGRSSENEDADQQASQNVPRELLRPYDRVSDSLFSAIEAGQVPCGLLEDVPSKYVNGTLVCEIRDYRNCSSEQMTGQTNGCPIIIRRDLRLSLENVVRDIALASDSSWDYSDLMEAEARIINALQPNLCLDPTPRLDKMGESSTSARLNLSLPRCRRMRQRQEVIVMPNTMTNGNAFIDEAQNSNSGTISGLPTAQQACNTPAGQNLDLYDKSGFVPNNFVQNGSVPDLPALPDMQTYQTGVESSRSMQDQGSGSFVFPSEALAAGHEETMMPYQNDAASLLGNNQDGQGSMFDFNRRTGDSPLGSELFHQQEAGQQREGLYWSDINQNNTVQSPLVSADALLQTQFLSNSGYFSSGSTVPQVGRAGAVPASMLGASQNEGVAATTSFPLGTLPQSQLQSNWDFSSGSMFPQVGAAAVPDPTFRASQSEKAAATTSILAGTLPQSQLLSNSGDFSSCSTVPQFGAFVAPDPMLGTSQNVNEATSFQDGTLPQIPFPSYSWDFSNGLMVPLVGAAAAPAPMFEASQNKEAATTSFPAGSLPQTPFLAYSGDLSNGSMAPQVGAAAAIPMPGASQNEKAAGTLFPDGVLPHGPLSSNFGDLSSGSMISQVGAGAVPSPTLGASQNENENFTSFPVGTLPQNLSVSNWGYLSSGSVVPQVGTVAASQTEKEANTSFLAGVFPPTSVTSNSRGFSRGSIVHQVGSVAAPVSTLGASQQEKAAVTSFPTGAFPQTPLPAKSRGLPSGLTIIQGRGAVGASRNKKAASGASILAGKVSRNKLRSNSGVGPSGSKMPQVGEAAALAPMLGASQNEKETTNSFLASAFPQTPLPSNSTGLSSSSMVPQAGVVAASAPMFGTSENEKEAITSSPDDDVPYTPFILNSADFSSGPMMPQVGGVSAPPMLGASQNEKEEADTSMPADAALKQRQFLSDLEEFLCGPTAPQIGEVAPPTTRRPSQKEKATHKSVPGISGSTPSTSRAKKSVQKLRKARVASSQEAQTSGLSRGSPSHQKMLDRLSKIDLVTTRKGLNSREIAKADEYKTNPHTYSPQKLMNCLPNTSDNESFTNDEKPLSRSLLDGTMNTVSESSQLPKRRRIILSEKPKDGTVALSNTDGDDVGDTPPAEDLLPTLPNTLMADLFAAQLTSMMKREGSVVEDHLEAKPGHEDTALLQPTDAFMYRRTSASDKQQCTEALPGPSNEVPKPASSSVNVYGNMRMFPPANPQASQMSQELLSSGVSMLSRFQQESDQQPFIQPPQSQQQQQQEQQSYQSLVREFQRQPTMPETNSMLHSDSIGQNSGMISANAQPPQPQQQQQEQQSYQSLLKEFQRQPTMPQTNSMLRSESIGQNSGMPSTNTQPLQPQQQQQEQQSYQFLLGEFQRQPAMPQTNSMLHSDSIGQNSGMHSANVQPPQPQQKQQNYGSWPREFQRQPTMPHTNSMLHSDSIRQNSGMHSANAQPLQPQQQQQEQQSYQSLLREFQRQSNMPSSLLHSESIDQNSGMPSSSVQPPQPQQQQQEQQSYQSLLQEFQRQPTMPQTNSMLHSELIGQNSGMPSTNAQPPQPQQQQQEQQSYQSSLGDFQRQPAMPQTNSMSMLHLESIGQNSGMPAANVQPPEPQQQQQSYQSLLREFQRQPTMPETNSMLHSDSISQNSGMHSANVQPPQPQQQQQSYRSLLKEFQRQPTMPETNSMLHSEPIGQNSDMHSANVQLPQPQQQQQEQQSYMHWANVQLPQPQQQQQEQQSYMHSANVQLPQPQQQQQEQQQQEQQSYMHSANVQLPQPQQQQQEQQSYLSLLREFQRQPTMPQTNSMLHSGSIGQNLGMHSANVQPPQPPQQQQEQQSYQPLLRELQRQPTMPQTNSVLHSDSIGQNSGMDPSTYMMNGMPSSLQRIQTLLRQQQLEQQQQQRRVLMEMMNMRNNNMLGDRGLGNSMSTREFGGAGVSTSNPNASILGIGNFSRRQVEYLSPLSNLSTMTEQFQQIGGMTAAHAAIIAAKNELANRSNVSALLSSGRMHLGGLAGPPLLGCRNYLKEAMERHAMSSAENAPNSTPEVNLHHNPEAQPQPQEPASSFHSVGSRPVDSTSNMGLPPQANQLQQQQFQQQVIPQQISQRSLVSPQGSIGEANIGGAANPEAFPSSPQISSHTHGSFGSSSNYNMDFSGANRSNFS